MIIGHHPCSGLAYKLINNVSELIRGLGNFGIVVVIDRAVLFE